MMRRLLTRDRVPDARCPVSGERAEQQRESSADRLRILACEVEPPAVWATRLALDKALREKWPTLI